MNLPALLRSKGHAAFSLLELLCVIAIIAVMLVATMPALSSLLQSSNMTRAGQLMVDQLSMARQIAAAKNRTVEVRLIKVSNGDGAYSGLQLWMVEPSGTSMPAQRLARFPNDVFITDNTTLSPLLTSWSGGTMAAGNRSDAPYKCFRIRPQGSVEPVPVPSDRSDFFLTFVNGRSTNTQTPPPNFITLQINPDTGSPLMFRP